MDLDLQAQIQKRLAELPADVRAAIQSADLAQKVQAIGKRNNLHIDQMSKLEDEVYLVMLGFADPAEFADVLADELKLAPAASVALATEISNEIFMPIRASMQAWTEEQTSKADAAFVSEVLATNKGTASKLPPIENPTPVLPPTPIPTPTPTDTTSADLAIVESILSPKTSSTTPAAPKPDPTRPQNYKADPYREPAE